VAFYQFGYAVVRDEVGDCTIEMYFHTAVVNNKKQYFGFMLSANLTRTIPV
jgi:hypothetical protein